MPVILITGIQAAGKSTVAQALAESLPNSVHVRGDTFRRMIVNGRVEMGPAVPDPVALEQLALRYELAATVADRYARAGFTVVLQDIILGEHLQRVVDQIESRPLHVVVLAPSPATVRERDAERQARRRKVAYRPGDEDVAALDHALRTSTARIGYWLDTSDLDVAATVARIREHLDSDPGISDRVGARGAPADTGIVVRRCEEGDVPLLAAAEPPGADIAARLFARQQRGESVYLLALVGGAVVGHGELLLGDEPELRHLQVAEASRGRGVGTALVRAAERMLPGGRLSMGVGLDNPQARRLYERLGYLGTGELTTTTYTYVDDEGSHTVTETDERLVKDLSV